MTSTGTGTPPHSSRWNAARQRQALDLSARYRHGASVPELADATGLSRATVLNRLRMVDTPMRTPNQTRRLHQDPDRARIADQLSADYRAGASVTALATQHDMSPRTVGRLLREAGTVLRSSAETRLLARTAQASENAQHRDQLRRWYESGVSVRALAAVHECSTATVYRQLKRAGTVMRPHGRTALGPGTEPP